LRRVSLRGEDAIEKWHEGSVVSTQWL